jgi:hypothetical protein
MTRVQLLCRTYFSSLVLLLMSNIGSALITEPQLDAITGGGCIFIYSCSARRISFESHCFYGMLNIIYEYYRV